MLQRAGRSAERHSLFLARSRAKAAETFQWLFCLFCPSLYRSQNSSACLSAQRPRIHRWKFQSPPSQIPLAKTEPSQRKRQKLLPSPKARANSPAPTPEGALNANGQGVAKTVLIAAVAVPAG
ncbi:unnamed protein product [Lepidochelys kempii]